ncbi:MAG: endonuclease/exonuclease/phosphatase family protein [Deltaproteobacteria bacterium]|nr:endonuclease/exonuclease/phosphatase family protein [Deltaproteobacteria bacterium]
MTLNIRYGSGCKDLDKRGYDLSTSHEKLAVAADAIRAINPDLVALQEVRNQLQAENLARLTGMNSIYMSHPIGYRLFFFEWGLAFLYRSTLIESGSRTIRIDEKTGVGRTGLMCRMKIRGTVVTFINVHFDHGEEAKQIQNIIQWLEDITSPVCMLGDLNLGPDDPVLHPLKERLADSCQLAQTRLSEEANIKGSLLKGDMRVDYIWIEPRFFTVQEAGLIPEPHRGVSDHIGYFADVLLI